MTRRFSFLKTPHTKTGFNVKAFHLLTVLSLFFVIFLVYQVLEHSGIQKSLEGVLSAYPQSAVIIFFFGAALLFSLAVPSAILGALAYLFFGFSAGSILAIVSFLFSSVVVFLLVRSIFREKVQRWIKKKPRLLRIQSVVEKQGLKFLCIVRYVPVHVTLMNCLLALSPVRFRHFFVSCCCLIPEWILYVYLGDLASFSSSVMGGAISPSTIHLLLRLGSLLIFLLVIFYLNSVARKALSQKEGIYSATKSQSH
ncbi:hypothetical protein A2V82_04550 [candidate division KSB1 bacterium RBG_16_48_16]|nr:MAG: hypothetical protein A2V82_04550 [candidate division KSB1 bacterium RBG_16_48_16]